MLANGTPPSSEVEIRLALPDSLTAVLRLVRACDEAPLWPRQAWAAFLAPEATRSPRRVLFAGFVQNEAAGILAGSFLESIAELELLLVHPAWRGKGLGRRLVETWLPWLSEQKVTEAQLEVRASNLTAQHLYRSLAFHEQGRRKNYYTGPAEDAVLMCRHV